MSKRVEIGSDFHWNYNNWKGRNRVKFPSNSIFFNSGRAALISLINWLQKEKGVTKIFIPSYYCKDVVIALENLDINIEYYFDNPLSDFNYINLSVKLKKSDLIILVNYFNSRNYTFSKNLFKPAILIGDISHSIDLFDPNLSKFDWCFSSLRKIYPIPDGGVIWCENGKDLSFLTPKWNKEFEKSASLRFSAMVLKALYLENHDIKKEDFRKIFFDTEKTFSSFNSSISNIAKNLLRILSLRGTEKTRQINYKAFSDNFIQSKKAYLFKRDVFLRDRCPFCILILFSDVLIRDKVKRLLIKDNIYPSILWPDCTIFDEDKNFSNQILCLPCDQRYDSKDMKWIANNINSYL